jgi:putative transcriptional regulator
VQPLQAHLLVASSDLAEPFNRSVVLVIRHGEEGALGLILNRRTDAMLEETWPRLSEVPCHRKASIFLGGPCEGPLVALHTQEFLLELEVMSGLFFCAAKDKLERLAAQQDGPDVKFFAGYSGWGPGQLEAEIARGSWGVMAAAPTHVFAQEDNLWVRANRHLTSANWRAALHIKHAPSDPSLN